MIESSTQRTWHDDPRVAEALRERPANDVCLFSCPNCGLYGYYDQGSSFHCLGCDSGFVVVCEDEDAPPDCAHIRLGSEDPVTVADAIEAECSDAYSMHED